MTEADKTPDNHSTRLDDPARLESLLRLAGPSAAAELLLRLEQDLARAQADLIAARDSHDTAGLRAASHVIVALVGTLGADALLDQSRKLNRQVQGASTPTDPALISGILSGLTNLLGIIRARRNLPGGAA